MMPLFEITCNQRKEKKNSGNKKKERKKTELLKIFGIISKLFLKEKTQPESNDPNTKVASGPALRAEGSLRSFSMS